MSNVSNPYIKKEKPTYTVPEYTPDNYFAQIDWNKEIANNKQGYMAVDIMSMKDFYDAGGYSFIDDYRGELADIDAAYDRALPGYGVKGEQMAKAGLTGTGYSDYLGGQAYAGRVAGQALARQNAMANSNSFRAAYNQYVTQQKEKRAANLQTVVDRAISVNMNPNNFVTIATRLGIPQADAERGLEQLIAYYQGIGMDGSGTISGTNTNTENSYTGLNTMQAQEAKEMKSALQAALKGYVNPETGEEVAPTAATIDAALAKYYGSTYSKDDPRVQAAIKELQFDELTQVESFAVTGQFTAAKTQLDALVTAGVVDENSEQYKAMLATIQTAVDNLVVDVLDNDTLDAYTESMMSMGANEEDLADMTEENARIKFFDQLDKAYKEGVVSTAMYNKLYDEDYSMGKKDIETKEQASAWINSIGVEFDKLGEKAKPLIEDVEIKYSNAWGGICKITINDESFRWDVAIEKIPGTNQNNYKVIDKELSGAKDGDIIVYNGELCRYEKVLGKWNIYKLHVSGKLNEESLTKILTAQGKNFNE